MKRIGTFEILDNYRIWLQFDDGVEGTADLSDLVGKGAFAAWRDYEFFRRASVADYGSLTWPGELDLCPDALWLQVTGKQPEDLLPLAQSAWAADWATAEEDEAWRDL